MRLKKLTIFGFKSFADKITLDFNAPVIGIVGPNGCGKSNIVDAFRWVMGEQSAKSLRGDKMHDLIFAGTESRKPLNFAEVSLLFSNEERRIPLDFDEVSISRKLYRSGESEYFINKNPARLKDIHSLFWDSGLGKDAFSIFEQGKLDQVINLNPEERRHIFDETAGIERFLQRKKEALKKLVQVTENYLRVKDLHSEVLKQTKNLEKQASAARQFRLKQQELKELQKLTLFLQWQKISKKIEESQSSLQDLENQNKEVSSALIFFEERKNANHKILREKELAFQKEREEMTRILTEVKLKTAEHEKVKQRLQDELKKKQRLQDERERLDAEKISEDSRYQSLEANFRHIAGSRQELEKELAEVKKSQKDQDSALLKLREEEQSSQKRYFELREQCQSASHKIKENEIHHENLRGRQKQLSLKKVQAEDKIAKADSDIVMQRARVKSITASVDEQKTEFLTLEKKINELAEILKQEQIQFNQLQVKLGELQARKKVLQQLKDECEGFSKGVKVLIQESKNPKAKIFGKVKTLSELIDVKSGFEKTVSSALKPYLETLIVENRSDLKTLMQFAEEKKITDFSLFCLEDCDSCLEGFGFEDAIEKSSVAIHFLKGIEKENGFLIDPRQVLFKISDGKVENNAFLRDAELKLIVKSLEELVPQKEAKQQLIAVGQENKDRMAEQRIHEDRKIRKEEMTLIQENFMLQKALAELDEARKQRIMQAGEESAIEKEIDEKNRLAQALKQQLSDAQTCQTQAEQLHHSLKRALVEQSENQKGLFRRYGEKNQQYQKILSEIQKFEQEKRVFQIKDQEKTRRIQQISQELESFSEDLKKQQESQKGLERELTQLNLDGEVTKVQLKEVEEQLLKLKKEMTQESERLELKKNAKQKVETQKITLEVTIKENQVKHQQLLEDFEGRFQAPIHDMELPSLLDPALDIEKKIKSLIDELEKVGNVNFDAIDAFEEEKKRFDFLNVQLEDLETTQNDIQELIRKLESESRKLFKKTFERVRENFQKNFQILFKGGEADLKFTESQDVLTAGIEIIAKPPGKQMRSISLLSGGEKCMTALALLFSIFEVKPAPFCILDEVDAPLDESNVDRFTDILKQFIDTTQFIMITHNRKTMAAADILFGVSMEEKGISRLISLEFERRQENHLAVEI